jgi:hypothetical protein
MACTACGSILNGIYKHAPMTREQVDDSRNRDREIVVITDADLFGSGSKAPSNLKKLLALLHTDNVAEPMRFTPAFEMTSDANDSDRRHLVTWEMMYAMRNNFGGLRYLKDGGIDVDGDEVNVTETVGSLRSFNGSEDGVIGGDNTGCITEVGKEGKFSVSLGQNSRVTGDFSTIAGGGGEGLDNGNKIDDGIASFIGAGSANTIAGASGKYSFIGAGSKNTIDSNYGGFIGAGSQNRIDGGSTYGAIVSARESYINNSIDGFIGAGYNIYITSATQSVIVGGGQNSITSASYAFIGGGRDNKIVGDNADYNAILAGYENKIESPNLINSSSILAGNNNTIENEVVGKGVTGSAIVGFSNKIGSTSAFISGSSNAISSFAPNTSILGGWYNKINGTESGSAGCGIIGGGSYNILSAAIGAFIGSGDKNKIDNGIASFIGAGSSNVVKGDQSFIGSGSSNVVEGDQSFIGSGESNTISGSAKRGVIIGGYLNEVTASTSTIVSGTNNKIISTIELFAIIGGGAGNEITSCNPYSSGILCGYGNKIKGVYGAQCCIVSGSGNYIQNGGYSIISGGNENKIEHPDSNVMYSFIGGGNLNKVTGSNSSIVGGNKNEITGSSLVYEAGASAAKYAVIAGGSANRIHKQSNSAGILCGEANVIGGGSGIYPASSDRSVIIGGSANTLDSSTDCIIVVGHKNILVNSSDCAIISGYVNEIHNASDSIICGGGGVGTANRIKPDGVGNIGGSFMGTPGTSIIHSSRSFIGTGSSIYIRLDGSFVGSGDNNYIEGNQSLHAGFSAILIGKNNMIESASYSGIVAGTGNSISYRYDRNSLVYDGAATDTNRVNIFIGGGQHNHAFAKDSGIVAGEGNHILSSCGDGTLRGRSFIGAGLDNEINATENSGIVSGQANKILEEATHSFIGSGYGNEISNGGVYSAIVGGYQNYIADAVDYMSNGYPAKKCGSFIGGGEMNRIESTQYCNSIVGGGRNKISGYTYLSVISGGDYNTISSSSVNSFIGAGHYVNIVTCNSASASGVCAAYITDSSFSTVSGTAMTVVDADYGNITGSRNFLIASRQSVISGVRNGISGSSESGILSGRYNMLGYMFYDGESKSMAVPDFGKPIDTRVLPSFNLNINRQLETETNAWKSYGGSSTIVGGAYNILASAFRSVISGGEKNLIDYAMNSCTIGGGYNNRIINFSTQNDTLYLMDDGSRDVAAVISGGKDNTIYYGDAYYNRPYTDIGNAITGGIGNTIGKEFYPCGQNQHNNEAGGVRASTIVGGENNMIAITNQSLYVASTLQYITIVGGKNNTITDFSKYSSIVGGVDNTLKSNGSMIGCVNTTSSASSGSILIGLGTISRSLYPFGPSISVESGTHKNESLNSAVFIENLRVYGLTNLYGLNVYGGGTDSNGRFKSYTPIFMGGKPIQGGYTYSSGESPTPDEINTAVIETNGIIRCSQLYVNRSTEATGTSTAGYIDCYKLRGRIVEGDDGQKATVQNFKYIFSKGYVHATTTIASSGSVLGKTITSIKDDFNYYSTPYYEVTYNGVMYNSNTSGNISSHNDMLAMGHVISAGNFIGDGVYVEESVYANNVLLTSDRRSKYDIAPLGYGLEFINSLSPVSYKYTVGGTEKNEEIVTEDVIDDNGEVTTKISRIKKATERKGIRTHFGLIAQDVKSVVDQYGVDFAGHSMDNKDDPESKQRLAYTEFIAPLIKSVQELSKQVTDLKAEINELKK